MKEKVSDGRVLEAAGSVSDPRGAGGDEALDAGSGNAPGRGDQSVAVQYLSGCARPRRWRRRASRWCGTRTTSWCCVAREAEAQQALAEVRRWTAQAGLTLHPVKTRIVDATQPGGFDFLGYHFERGCKWPRRKSERKFQRHDSGQDPAHARAEPGGHHRRSEPNPGEAGSSIFNTAIRPRSPRWTAGCACACAASCAAGGAARDRGAERTISAGPTPTLRSAGCSPWSQPMPPPVSPLGGNTTDWRAGCGRSASPVRREGERQSRSPYPYHQGSGERT